MLGALQIRSLMHEVVDSKKMTLKQFNDAFLHEGAMPIEMMRATLEGQPLTRDYQAQLEVLRRRRRRAGRGVRASTIDHGADSQDHDEAPT